MEIKCELKSCLEHEEPVKNYWPLRQEENQIELQKRQCSKCFKEESMSNVESSIGKVLTINLLKI